MLLQDKHFKALIDFANHNEHSSPYRIWYCFHFYTENTVFDNLYIEGMALLLSNLAHS